MKCLVAIKRVVDPYVHIRVNKEGTGVETNNVKMAMNPFDEIAVEEAIRLKEKGSVSEVRVVSIGDDKCQETLRQALALGADSAVLIKSDSSLSPLLIAKILASYSKEYEPGLILLGKQSIDGDNNQTAQMLAGLLDYTQGTFASKLTLSADTIEVEREVDSGIETIKLKLPSVISTDLRLNEPRYATLPNVMKAKSKPLEKRDISDFNIDIESKIKLVSVSSPEQRKAGIMVSDTNELVDKLKNEAKVL